MKNGLGDLWMPCVCFLGLLASLGFGLHKVNLLFVFAECATSTMYHKYGLCTCDTAYYTLHVASRDL